MNRNDKTQAVGSGLEHEDDAEPGLRPEDVTEEEERRPPLPVLEEEPSPELDRTAPGELEAAAPLVDSEATARRSSGQQAVDLVIIHPSQTRLTCPGCQLSYPTHHSLVRHVGVSRKRLTLKITFKCAVCDYAHVNLRSTSNHFRLTHGPPSAS